MDREIRITELHTRTRRHFLRECSLGLGGLAFADMVAGGGCAAETSSVVNPLAPKAPMMPAKAKRIIYLHMSGAPPQHELFDWKPELVKHHMQPCPESLMQGQRFPFIKGHPNLLGTPYKFAQHGQAGTWVSELLPEVSKHADELCVIHSLHTDQFNHAPAELFLYTGSPRNGGAAMGSWITWGLGSENQDLPGFVVLVSGGTDPTGGKALWSTGFLPTVYQGVQCRTTGEPILYANNPKGVSRETRRRGLDALKTLNEYELSQYGDPETIARIGQFELAYRMQVAVPEVMDIGRETKGTLEAYGAQPGAASFANNCLLARRLVEQGVRYVQLYDWGWDCHGTGAGDDIVNHLPNKCKQIDRAISALLADLMQRDMLKDTLVVWGGEFGRTSMNEARGGSKFLGRDHHPHCFTIWMAGGGIKPGTNVGETDDLGYFVTKDKVGVHDVQATILHLMGLDPHRLSYFDQGLNQRLIGPENSPKVIAGALA
jgi:hypothetical protein